MANITILEEFYDFEMHNGQIEKHSKQKILGMGLKNLGINWGYSNLFNYQILKETWTSQSELPSEEEIINAAKNEFEVEELQMYKNKRAIEYPSFAEQFDLLYHGGYDAWKSKITEIKEKYPKAE